MPSHADEARLHLFMARVWTKQLDDTHMEWRCTLPRALNGESLYFRDWETMPAFLMGKTSATPEPGAEEGWR